jgi:hypothetical protein
MGTNKPAGAEKANNDKGILVEAGELNRPRDSQPKTEKVLDSTAKSKSSGHFLEGKKGPKMPEKDPDNPEKNRTGSGRLNGDLPDEIVDAEQAGKAPIGVDRFPRMLDC